MKIKTCVFFISLCLCGFYAYAAETLTVAVASSLYPEMQRQAETFEKGHDVSIRMVPGSTGRLYNQIMQGAPFDVFIAADEQRPELLAKQGKAIEVHEVGQGYLGVKLGRQVITDSRLLTDPSIRHIVIANPDVAPFGQASKDVLQQQRLWQVLKHKFIYARNAMQAEMMVNKGLVDAGFVPVSSRENSIAVIHYYGVVLADRAKARQWLNSIAVSQNMVQARQIVLQKR